MTRLLDVNVLLALAWPNHVHHARAVHWFRVQGESGWATCPLTESGFVRVSSNARVIPHARRPSEAIELLREMRRLNGHEFWEDDVSPAHEGAAAFHRVVGHRQLTDAHLLTLAVRRGGRLATFDQSIGELTPSSDSGLVELIP